MIALMILAAASAGYRTLVPIGDTKAWFSDADYPADAIAARKEGLVHFVVVVDTAGKPSACRIVRSSGAPSLDEATCKALMARAAFHPMVDFKGRPTTGLFEQEVRWHLPKQGGADAVSDGTFEANSRIGPNGEIVQCVMSGQGLSRFGDTGNACGPFGERGFLAAQMGGDYAKARNAHVRMQISYEGLPQHGTGRTPDFYLLLAEAEIAVNGDGTMGRCTSLRALDLQGRSINLCNIVAMAPPRFPPGAAKRAVYVLDLSVDEK